MSTNGFTPALWNRIKSLWSCPSVVEKPAKLPSSQTTLDAEDSQQRCLKNAELVDQISEAKRCLQDLISERLSKDQQMINMRKSYAMFCHEYENLLETYEQGFTEQSKAISQLSEAVQQERGQHKESMKKLQLENQQLKKQLSASNEALAETCDLTEQFFEQISDSVSALLSCCQTHTRDAQRRQRAAERQSRAVLAKFRAWKSKKAEECKRRAARPAPRQPSLLTPKNLSQSSFQCSLSTVPARSTARWCWQRSILRTADRHRRRDFESFGPERCTTARQRQRKEEEEEDDEVRPEESVSQIHCRSQFKYPRLPVSTFPRSTFSVPQKNWTSDSSESGISLDRLNELLDL